ncbi:MAG: branched-chain amino acid ABC transporter permease [Deltaproteobacteria bacterium]|nr:branched-chain amino acid ABC transporter permease [Deltaproteobacteria bacterium]
MSFLTIQLFNGLSYGLLLFIVASGLTLMFGLMRIVNLAHGSYYLLAGYIGYSVAQATGSFMLAAVSGIVAIGLIGLVMERTLFRMLHNQELEQVLLSFGLIYIFQDIFHWIWGGQVYSIAKPSLLSESLVVSGMFFPSYRLALLILGLVVAFGLWFLQEKTLVGAIIRAGVDDREMLSGMGINVNRYFTLVFTLGAALAGLGGVMGAPFVSIYPGIDMELLILALVIIVIGGLGSLTGALISSILIGLADAFGKAFIPQFAMFSIYALMALVLVFRPWGLLGRKE